jgi:hypothetical protein
MDGLLLPLRFFRETFQNPTLLLAIFAEQMAFRRTFSAKNQNRFSNPAIYPVLVGFSASTTRLYAGINFSGGRIGYNFVRTKPQKPNAMKTIAKVLFAISILILSFEANAGKEVKGFVTSTKQIIYHVSAHMDALTPATIRNIFIIITDENGRPVAPAKLLVSGRSEYRFYEAGPVKGVRIAKLIRANGMEVQPILSGEDSKTGKFENGTDYFFNLYIAIPSPVKGGKD